MFVKKKVNFIALNMSLRLFLHEILHQYTVAWRRTQCGCAEV